MFPIEVELAIIEVVEYLCPSQRIIVNGAFVYICVYLVIVVAGYITEDKFCCVIGIRSGIWNRNCSI